MQLILLVTLGHDTAARLEPEFVVAGHEGTDGDGLVKGTVEPDESDASFLNLMPVLAAVTNIDADHMDTYGHDFGRLKKAFVDFIERLPFYGVAILCVDDENVRSIIPSLSKRVIGYGLSEAADVRAIDVRSTGTQMAFTILRATFSVLRSIG